MPWPKSSYDAYAVKSISNDIMIMTRQEFKTETNKAFLAGFERGRFEQRCADAARAPSSASSTEVPAASTDRAADAVQKDTGGTSRPPQTLNTNGETR